jgi:methionyl-tRNA formyltransferase
VNVHFSLLPRWRGAAPVQRSILAGDTISGVTTMLMDAGVDTGDVLLTRETPVEPEETAGELGARLASLGAPLLVETLDALAAGRLDPRSQDDEVATRAPALRKDEAWVDWTAPAAAIARQVRALQPWPVARTLVGERELRLLQAVGSESVERAQPGEVLGLRGDALAVACGEGSELLLSRVQPAGGRPMSGRAAVAGRHLRAGDRLASRPEASGGGSV